ncbi:MAG: molybdopterin molybdenumtransferase MoeA, partial [Pseudomonadota bacterium]
MKSNPIDTLPSCSDREEDGMLRFEQARQRILDNIEPLMGYEKVPLQKSAGRILHEPLVSPINVPSHTNSAVDGFAVRSTDLPSTGQSTDLAVVGTALAGKPYRLPLNKGETVRIM